MFIYMSALLFNLSFNLIGRIGFFFGRRLKMIFYIVKKELEISFLSLCILRDETFDIDDLSRMILHVSIVCHGSLTRNL